MFWWNPFFWHLQNLKSEPDENVREVIPEEIWDAPWKLRTVGAWVGWGSFRTTSSMIDAIKFAKKLGLGRIDVIVNDHSKDRAERSFTTYDKARIKEFCKRLVDANFHVHLMTWWMPHTNYIQSGGEQLRALVRSTGARSVMLDAEEPWTKARKPLSWEDAALKTAEVLKDIRFGVTGIGYTPKDKLGPLVRRAAYMTPQCYSTNRNLLNPVTACPQLVDRWKRSFGDREIVLGLAAYLQEGRPGYSKKNFMTTAFNAAEGTKPTDIVYWSLRHIRSSRTTANVIKKLTMRARHRA